MSADGKVPMVRCHLEGGDEDPALALRYIPAAEFERWRHFMETSFLAAETYLTAKAALLAHADPGCGRRLEEPPGYFVPAESMRSALDTDFVLG